MTDMPLTSLQRVLTTLQQKEPDRVPFFLLLTIHGARELGMPIQEYFSKAENMVEGQLRMRKRYRHDCLYGFSYASAELEAFGGSTIFFDNGPPNAAAPILHSFEDIVALKPPRVQDHACLTRVLDAQTMMKEQVGDEAPIIGVVMSPFSLPVMQLGFERYLDIIIDTPDVLQDLLAVNEAFCIEWANAQLAAGATAICFFDPVSSPTVISPRQYRETGFKSAVRTIAQINGPTATHFASGRCLPVINDLVETKTGLIAASVHEDLSEVKVASAGRLTVFGNLNGIEMRRWTPEQAEATVKAAIEKAGRGGGFILSDNHGEIPWQVPEAVLDSISKAVHEWGHYPLDWISD
ncbi:uroporphyrinogen decarboxylase family protein [Pseudomonadota bacterium]